MNLAQTADLRRRWHRFQSHSTKAKVAAKCQPIPSSYPSRILLPSPPRSHCPTVGHTDRLLVTLPLTPSLALPLPSQAHGPARQRRRSRCLPAAAAAAAAAAPSGAAAPRVAACSASCRRAARGRRPARPQLLLLLLVRELAPALSFDALHHGRLDQLRGGLGALGQRPPAGQPCGLCLVASSGNCIQTPTGPRTVKAPPWHEPRSLVVY